MKRFMGIDQYGRTYHDLLNPRKELAEMFGYSSSSLRKIYVDDIHGNTYHTGYVVGDLWITLYEVKEYRRIA